MRDSFFKLFGSVRLVQEVTRSNQSSNTTSSSSLNVDSESTLQDPSSTIETNPTKPIDDKIIEKQEEQPKPKQKHITVSSPTVLNNHNKPRNLLPATRKNTTKYTIRHYRTRQASISDRKQKEEQQLDGQKSKSQKLLCLWPLPTLTRYMILIALFISTLNFLDVLDLSCAAPSYVIHQLDFKNLILSPFLFDWTFPSLVLFGWNVLILGLFEESLAHMLGGTRRFIGLLSFMFFIVSSLRLLLGFIFSKSTGWAFPSLFFSNSMHECSQVVQSLSIDDKYILIYGQEESQKITVRKLTLQFIMCLVNYTTRNILWWSISGLLTGFLATIIFQTLLACEKREDSTKVKDLNEFITLEHYRRTPLWRLIWSAIKKGLIVVFLIFPVLMACNSYYTREFMVTSTELNTVSQDKYLFTMVFMTAPRRGDPAYLSRTIESYLENWPEYPTADSPYSRMQAIVYTHFTNHTQFELAQQHFSNTVKGRRYLKWIHNDGNEWNQRLHVSKALDFVTTNYQSTYYALMEDDFPVCGNKEWHEIENVIYKAQKNVPSHCGVFVGTGGSGLFLRPDLARLASQLLLQYVDTPPDIIIQKCLMGLLPECAHCSDSLVTSKTLLMYHIGYNTSTSDDRVYKKDEFQCGWRHPFNGDPRVITL
ncbi:hypothetical protein INT48_000598 [Thamnidium elegans]|uniref:Uncharacterized protein n=1 Tax=Thamnidium elegans TaxID=101142 RepID=A0A8H7SK54_9FUNG|nr:hypothetical protein INT48_000598 [Thamnidium elegans]